jgi:C1A family cysteine protease
MNKPYLPRRRSTLFRASAMASGLALMSLAGCDGSEPVEELTPVSADQIDGNDVPLGITAELKKDFPGDDTLPFEGKADVVLPTKFDLYTGMTPVKSQGSRGVCSIFSTMGLMEMLYKKAGMSNPDFSEQYLQWSVKVQVGAYTYTEGSSDNYNLQAIYRYGVPVESAWAYESLPWGTSNDPACTGESRPTKCYTNGEPPAAAKSAKKYFLPAGRWVSTSSIKNVIYEKKTGVVVGLDFFYQSWNHRKSTLPVNATYWSKGYVLHPNATDRTESYKQPAGHSVQLMGWDDNLEVQTVDAAGKPVVDATGKPVKEKGFFLFKNSWGTASFGATNSRGAGYGWISYKYVNAYGSGNTSDPPVLTP